MKYDDSAWWDLFYEKVLDEQARFKMYDTRFFTRIAQAYLISTLHKLERDGKISFEQEKDILDEFYELSYTKSSNEVYLDLRIYLGLHINEKK